jgi:hypothetical protein
MLVQRICENCGVSFHRAPSQIKRRLFCTKACYLAVHKRAPKIRRRVLLLDPGPRPCECGCGTMVTGHRGTKRGLVRFARGHSSRRPLKPRLWSQVICYLSTGCWLWTGARDSHGYGVISVDGDLRRVHRTVFELEHGVCLESGTLLRHACDVRACCRPDHLVPGSNRENTDDMLRHNRGRGLWSGVPEHLSNANLSRLAVPG